MKLMFLNLQLKSHIRKCPSIVIGCTSIVLVVFFPRQVRGQGLSIPSIESLPVREIREEGYDTYDISGAHYVSGIEGNIIDKRDFSCLYSITGVASYGCHSDFDLSRRAEVRRHVIADGTHISAYTSYLSECFLTDGRSGEVLSPLSIIDPNNSEGRLYYDAGFTYYGGDNQHFVSGIHGEHYIVSCEIEPDRALQMIRSGNIAQMSVVQTQQDDCDETEARLAALEAIRVDFQDIATKIDRIQDQMIKTEREIRKLNTENDSLHVAYEALLAQRSEQLKDWCEAIDNNILYRSRPLECRQIPSVPPSVSVPSPPMRLPRTSRRQLVMQTGIALIEFLSELLLNDISTNVSGSSLEDTLREIEDLRGQINTKESLIQLKTEDIARGDEVIQRDARNAYHRYVTEVLQEPLRELNYWEGIDALNPGSALFYMLNDIEARMHDLHNRLECR